MTTNRTARFLGHSLLSAGCLILPLAVADAVAQQMSQGEALEARVIETPTAASTTALVEVDRMLLEALRAPQEDSRRVALQKAQQRLDQLSASDVPTGKTAREDRFKVPTEDDVEAFEARAQQQLRRALMLAIWASPFDGFDASRPEEFDSVSDALRVLREFNHASDGDTTSALDLQATYWDWLTAYRTQSGIHVTAVDEQPSASVFEQRLMRDSEGRVQLYQLTARPDRTLQWEAVAEHPVSELGGGGLAVNLEREAAPVLLVFEGAGLSRYLAEHGHWLEAVSHRARLVLAYQEDYLSDLRALDLTRLGDGARLPYVLPNGAGADGPSVRIIDVSGQREVGHWALDRLDSPDAAALKALMYQIIAAIGGR